MKKKFTILANCQGLLLSRLLIAHSDFQRDYFYTPLPNHVHRLMLSDEEMVYKTVSEADLFIHQHVSARLGAFSSCNLLQRLNVRAKRVSIKNAYFTGYNPELTNRIKVPVFYNKDGTISYNMQDLNIFLSYVHGYSEIDTIDYLKRDQNKKYVSISRKNIKNSLDELSKREENADIKACEYIRSNYRSERLFNTFNHPSLSVCFHIADALLAYMGYEPLDMATKSKFNRFTGSIVNFIYPCSRDMFDFDCSNDVVIYHEPHSLQQYISKYYRAYRKHPDDVEFSHSELMESGDPLTLSFLNLFQ